MKKQFSLKTVAVLLLATLLVSGFVFYVLAQTPSSTFWVAPGVYPGAPSYTVWRESSNYFAKNENGEIAYSGTNASAVFEDIIGDMPSYGGTIHLRPSEYVGWIVINRDGIILEGEGSYSDIPTGIPDNSPTELYGSVLRVTESGKDAIQILGQRHGIVIRDLGIWFNVSSTGHGINIDNNQGYALTHGRIENIKVLDCDSDSYAIRILNFLHCKISGIMAWGGGGLEMFANKDNFHAGNSIVELFYSYIKYDMTPCVLATGPYPIFIHKNDSLTDNYINLMTFNRIQVNHPTTQTDSDWYAFVSFDLRYSDFVELDLEGVNNNTLKLGSNYHVTFSTAYLWTQDPGDAYSNIAADNSYITFINSELEDIIDSNHTNRYINCNVVNDIDASTLSEFIGLDGNSGYATLASGASSMLVNATWIGANSMIFLTISESTPLDAGESLRVDTVDSANNRFTIDCIDGGTASTDIGFFWEVTSSKVG